MRWLVLSLLLLAGLAGPARAAEVRVAVAGNFRPAMAALAAAFQHDSGHELRISYGATGALFARIVNGAPYAVLLAADAATPERLEREGRAIAGSRFTYAIGRLALFSRRYPAAALADFGVLGRGARLRLALANPRLAPYGRAARAALARAGLWRRLTGRLVFGANVAQAFQFVDAGAADAGLVALAHARRANGGAFWIVPENLHPPLVQQAVLLKDEAAARAFLAFLRTAKARAIIRRFGYRVPADADAH